MLVEFRCCCVPRKVKGTIDLPESLVRRGPIQFALPPESMHGARDVLCLEIDILTDYDNHRQFLAIKAEENIPIETLERIPGFKRDISYGRD